MRTEDLDQRIRIERPQPAMDADWGPQGAQWVEVMTVWAQVQDVLPSKGETQTSGVQVSTGRSRIRIRFTKGITSDMRVVQLHRDNRVLQIVSQPAELGRKEWLEFMAETYSTKGTV
jgi:SPP1 family predicted phage head-tail adaptor